MKKWKGYASRYGVQCTDKRIIDKGSFAHQNGSTVPVLYRHFDDDISNVIGKAVITHTDEGPMVDIEFNDTPNGRLADMQVEHGDLTDLSIRATNIRQTGSHVTYGDIKEVSLVVAGANPGAKILNTSFAHGDEEIEIADEAIITIGSEIIHEDGGEKKPPTTGKTVGEILDSMTDEQKAVVTYLMGEAAEENDENENGGDDMKHSAFDKTQKQTTGGVITHDQFATIKADAIKCGSLKSAVLAHAAEYGIKEIATLFPDAKEITDPQWITRDITWVDGVLMKCRKSPFAVTRTTFVDTAFDDAVAKGYIKATEKKEVYLKVSKRKVHPGTIYVKQKVDRDDVIDITDFSIVDMIRKQLDILLKEEMAVAILIGDGRLADNPDKIDEACIIPVISDDALMSMKYEVTIPDVAGKKDYEALIEFISLQHADLKGSGNETLYIQPAIHSKMLWIRDTNGRRIYTTDAELASAMRCKEIVDVEQFARKPELLAVKVNMADYNIGTNKGGQVTDFDNFDIDFNQYKFLKETRISGALYKPKSCQVFKSPKVQG